MYTPDERISKVNMLKFHVPMFAKSFCEVKKITST